MTLTGLRPTVIGFYNLVDLFLPLLCRGVAVGKCKGTVQLLLNLPHRGDGCQGNRRDPIRFPTLAIPCVPVTLWAVQELIPIPPCQTFGIACVGQVVEWNFLFLSTRSFLSHIGQELNCEAIRHPRLSLRRGECVLALTFQPESRGCRMAWQLSSCPM